MDIGASNWNEIDSSNTTAAPDGAPEGMVPSGVNDVLRAHQGALKRFYDWQSVKATGGTNTAYTLSYAVAPGALVDGMAHVVQFNAANGASATLNVNGLGPKPLYMYLGVSATGAAWAAAPAGAINANDVGTVYYSASAGAYYLTLRPGSPLVWQSAPVAASAVDITSIPATINNLSIQFRLFPSINGAQLNLQFYGSGGSLDTGANYDYALQAANTSAGSGDAGTTGVAAIVVAFGVNNSSGFGITGRIDIQDIQRAASTGCVFQSMYFDSGGAIHIASSGGGWHAVAANITGFRLAFSGGTETGTVTTTGSI